MNVEAEPGAWYPNSTFVANRVVYMEYTPSYPEREGSYLDHLGAQYRPTPPLRRRYELQRSNRYRCDASLSPIAHHLSYFRELLTGYDTLV